MTRPDAMIACAALMACLPCVAEPADAGDDRPRTGPMPTLLAQAGAAYDVGHLLILAIVIAAIVGIAFVVTRQAGLVIPAFLVTIFWILVAVVVGIAAIKFLMGMV